MGKGEFESINVAALVYDPMANDAGMGMEGSRLWSKGYAAESCLVRALAAQLHVLLGGTNLKLSDREEGVC